MVTVGRENDDQPEASAGILLRHLRMTQRIVKQQQ